MDNNTRKKKKNKSKYSPSSYFALPHALIDHPDFLSMNWSSQALLIHMCRLYNGFNNGDISIPHSIMKNKGWSKSSLEDGKKELLKMNWLVLTRQGHKHQCSLFALSWIPLDECKSKLDITHKAYSIRSLKP